MRIISLIRSYLAALGVLAVLSVSASGVLAYNPLDKACNSANVSGSSTCVDSSKQTGKNSDNPVIKSVAWTTKVISLICGFVALILIVVSGLNMITSAGNTDSVANARKRLTAAIIGLVVASFAWVLASYVVKQLL
ncbi:MAG TPA: hypothetical protein VG964_03270 [Candidatus Saccharimonadales bacterium]|nr:hypothetical protein [Candidatus Saccharimonadales bacterium]